MLMRGKYEKTALSDGSIGFVPFGNNWYFCLTQGVNLTFGQGTRSGYLPAESGSGGRIRTGDQLVNSQLRYRCATPEHSSNYSDFIYYRQGEN